MSRFTLNKYDFLVGLPSSYAAFKYSLKVASIEELREALKIMEGKHGKKTACRLISARIQRLEKEQK